MRDDLENGGGALAQLGDEIVGCLRFQREVGFLKVRRVAVHPAYQRQGIGMALISWAHAYARDLDYSEVRVGVRLKLPGNIRFYEQLGYRVIAEHRHPGYAEVTWVEMAKGV